MHRDVRLRYLQTTPDVHLAFLCLQLAPKIGPNDNTRLPKYGKTLKYRYWESPRWLRPYVKPDGKNRNSEKMVDENKRLSNDARQKAHRPVNAVAACLEVAEATHLQHFELWI